jgi:cysteine desulfuration protein SufE
MTADGAIREIVENFRLIEDWEDRYRYLIELGKTLAPLAPHEICDANKVRGCASQVWLVSSLEPGPGGAAALRLRGDSDAHIVRGLIAILIALYSGRRAEEAARLDASELFAGLGLKDHLTPQRSNGLAAMVARIRADANAAARSAEQSASGG